MAEDIISRLSASVLEESPRLGFKRLRIPGLERVEDVLRQLRLNPLVEWAEPNYLVTTDFAPNDPCYTYQWHLDNGVYGGIGIEKTGRWRWVTQAS
ncbi:MAG: hypothetical protein SWK76_01335 [Actinomycetota bacterium]|nr:hypothetical protein [Actinomycetota bacterium]